MDIRWGLLVGQSRNAIIAYVVCLETVRRGPVRTTTVQRLEITAPSHTRYNNQTQSNHVAYIHNVRTSVQANLQVLPEPPGISRAKHQLPSSIIVMDDYDAPPFAVARHTHLGGQQPQRFNINTQLSHVSFALGFWLELG
ncbi:hypothetical protein GGR58DRAFT_500756 [Xylaria digitata]|nr:hypothetical protein GGR58DRAFT_500756 [Xylaria digitata]